MVQVLQVAELAQLNMSMRGGEKDVVNHPESLMLGMHWGLLHRGGL